MIVADILTSYIEDSLKEINLGNGSIIGFVTENGREVIFENIPECDAGTDAFIVQCRYPHLQMGVL